VHHRSDAVASRPAAETLVRPTPLDNHALSTQPFELQGTLCSLKVHYYSYRLTGSVLAFRAATRAALLCRLAL